jgi:hypothetical protein
MLNTVEGGCILLDTKGNFALRPAALLLFKSQRPATEES